MAERIATGQDLPRRRRTRFQRNIGWIAATYAVLSWPLAFGLYQLSEELGSTLRTLTMSHVVAALWFACAPIGLALGVCAAVVGVRHRHGWTIAAGVLALLSALALGAGILAVCAILAAL